MSRILRLLAATGVVAAVVCAVPLPASAGAPVSAVRQTPSPKRPHPHRKPWPITLTVRTVPALPGIRFTLDGTVRTTGPDGVASWTQEHNYSLHALTLLDTGIDRSAQRYRFTRWAGQRDPQQAFRTTVTGLPMRRSYTIAAAFDVQYPVRATFVDQTGNPIDPSSITAVRVKSDTGQVLAFPTDGPIWLAGTRLTYNKSALEEEDVTYSLQSMTIRGTNVVDAGRQKFVPARSATVSFVGQFHDLTVRAHDALFGSAAGSSARVTYPDGTVTTVPFGSDHSVTLRHLPRGTYQVSVVGSGIVMSDQFTLSRDHASDLTVLSRSDEALLGVAVLVLAIGLLLLGRAGLRRLLRTASKSAGRQMRDVPGAARRIQARLSGWIPAPRGASEETATEETVTEETVTDETEAEAERDDETEGAPV